MPNSDAQLMDYGSLANRLSYIMGQTIEPSLLSSFENPTVSADKLMGATCQTRFSPPSIAPGLIGYSGYVYFELADKGKSIYLADFSQSPHTNNELVRMALTSFIELVDRSKQ